MRPTDLALLTGLIYGAIGGAALTGAILLGAARRRTVNAVAESLREATGADLFEGDELAAWGGAYPRIDASTAGVVPLHPRR